MKHSFLKILVLSLYIFMMVTACDETNGDYDDIEVNIIEFTEKRIYVWEDQLRRFDYKANISYTVENVGTKTVEGWEIFFNVALTRGPNFIATDNKIFVLEPDSTSSIQIAVGTIPEAFEEETIRAISLKNIETW